MKISFIAAASTPTITSKTSQIQPQQQVMPKPIFLNEIFVYAPLFGSFGFGIIVGSIITSLVNWSIHIDKKKHTEKVKGGENAKDVAEYWQNYLMKNSSLQGMEDDTRYYELTQCLSSSAQEELSIKFEEYKIEFKSFYEIELPKLRSEARNDARQGRKMFEEFIKSPTDDSLESILYSENMKDFKDKKREQLEKPLRNFLIKELTKLKMMSTL